MNERERAKLSIVRCTRARTVQGRAHGSNEDAQHGAGDVRVRLEEGAQPLHDWDGFSGAIPKTSATVAEVLKKRLHRPRPARLRCPPTSPPARPISPIAK